MYPAPNLLLAACWDGGRSDTVRLTDRLWNEKPVFGNQVVLASSNFGNPE